MKTPSAKSHASQASRNPAGRPKDISKRADIIRAAESLFLQKGYESASMLAVAKKANVSKLTIYSHFKDKDALFKEVISQKCMQFTEADAYLDLAQKPLNEALYEIAKNFTRLVFSDDALCLHRIVQGELHRHPRVVKMFFEAGPHRVRSNFVQLLETWEMQGKVAIPDAAKAAEHFFSLLKGELHMRIMMRLKPAPTRADIEKHIQSVLFVFLSAYQK